MKGESEQDQPFLAGRQAVLHEILRSMGECLDTEAVPHVVVEVLARLTGWSVSLVVPDETGSRLVVQVAAGQISSEEVESLPLDQGIVGSAFREARVQHLPGAAVAPDGPGDRPANRSEVAIPLLWGGQVLGVLCVGSDWPATFGGEDMVMLETLAGVVALALDNVRLHMAAQQAVDDERQRVEAASLEAGQAGEGKGRVAGALVIRMSHQLRTPLSAVIGYSDLLREQLEYMNLADLIPDVNKIRLAGLHLLEMIQDMVDLAKLEAGVLPLNLEDLQAVDLVDDVVAAAKPLISRNNNVLEVHCPAGLYLCTDEVKLRRVLSALLSNAAKFTTKGMITLVVSLESTADSSDRVCFRVTDTGAGMTPEEVQMICQPFTRVYTAEPRRDGNVGLGLIISQAFCRMMGGEISVESEVGKGSTFTVRLPIAGPQPG